jgi:D-alanyl-D-alanine carboxypeptidase/D-alanyl-D-alanine-endopeptidase (penicillin-binding protein 4)
VVTVEGRVPAGGRTQVVWRRVDDPAAYFGATLKRLLELRGVKVTGRVRRGAVPERATLVAWSESEALGDVVRRLEKLSNNFMAEQVLKTLGAEIRGAPGTWPKGVAAVQEYLAGVGIAPGTYLMTNGSGLNDANRFSARQTVTLLEAMWRRFPLQAEFVASLPVAARDGTIRWRMEGTPAAGRLRAKTGTLESVASLSGYVETVVGERLAFAVIVNDHEGRAGAVRGIDELGAALAAGGVALAPPAVATHASHLPDLPARVAAYYRLGAAGDRRNLPFLRTALRSETDPVLRLAAAESVYLSDPDGDAARRTLLDTASAERASLAALAIAAGGARPSPVLGSVADLAAEGSSEAMVLLASITSAGAPEDLSRAWEEISASAPVETVSLLVAAPEPIRSAVLGVLADGLAATGGPSHPFVAELRRAADVPGDAGAPARWVLHRLETSLAAAPARGTRPAPPGGG